MMDSISNISGQLSIPTNETEATKGEKVAQEFEALFMHMVLKTAREANEAFQSGMFHDHATDMYQDMLDDALSKHLAQNKILGLSEKICAQFHLNEQAKTNE